MDASNLLALAGNTLVAAAVTDAWETTRHRFAQLFGRGKADPATERRLEATRNQLTTVPPGDLKQAQANLASQWALRLADLLGDAPEAETELRALVEEISAMLPYGAVSAVDHAVAAGRDVNIHGSATVGVQNGGMSVGVLFGDVATPTPTRSSFVSGQPDQDSSETED
jgi:hypothetical protein